MAEKMSNIGKIEVFMLKKDKNKRIL